MGRREVLHALRTAGVADADAVAARTGLPADVVVRTLAELDADGLVVHRTGALAGWQQTPAGRAEGERLVADEVDRSGVRDDLLAAYERFLDLNDEVLALLTRWQVLDTAAGPVANDHADAARDARILADLEALHGRTGALLDQLASALGRLARYRERLDRALDHVLAGELRWVDSPAVGSYHQVWFELHEDLLATLGLDRAAEAAARVRWQDDGVR